MFIALLKLLKPTLSIGNQKETQKNYKQFNLLPVLYVFLHGCDPCFFLVNGKNIFC
jgi:hypothetical protein